MSSSVNKIVRNQLKHECPTAWDVKDAFIDQKLERMSHVELLKRISDAIEFAARDGRVVHHTTRIGGGGGNSANTTGAGGAGCVGYPKDDTQ